MTVTLLALGLSRSVTAAPVTLHLAALNDFHGALYESVDPATGQAMGGLPVLAGALDLLRAEHPDLLVLDGGDLFQGAWPVNATLGRGAVEAYNLLGVDAAALGNHEFDYGGVEGGHPLRGALEAAAARAEFAWLSANVSDASGAPWGPGGPRPWTMLERSGVRVGVIGLTTTSTPASTLARNVADLRFLDPVERLRELVPEVRAAGADVVVVVGHLGGSCETPVYDRVPTRCRPGLELGRLLTELPPGFVDVVISGHTHTLLGQRFGDTWVLQQRSKGQFVGRLDLVVDQGRVDHLRSRVLPPWPLRHVPLDPGCTSDAPYPVAPVDVGGRTVTPSATAVALIEALEAEAGGLCDPLGCASATLLRRDGEESEVGNLVADAMMAAFPPGSIDVAIQNGGGLRGDLEAGPILREDVFAVMPFPNRLVVLELRGADLRTALRIGASGAHRVMQVAGASYHFDPASTAGSDLDEDGTVEGWETDRLCGARVGGRPLDDDAVYRVVTSDFLLDGGDQMGFALQRGKLLEQGPLVSDVLAAYLSARGGCVGEGAERLDPRHPRVVRGPCPP